MGVECLVWEVAVDVLEVGRLDVARLEWNGSGGLGVEGWSGYAG